MLNFFKPSKEDLKPLVDEVGDLAAWEEKFIKSLIEFLSKNPLRYRGFGPYWWLVKKAIIEHGENAFGDQVDAETVEALDYGERAINLLASYAYSEAMFDEGNMTSNHHVMATTDGESVDYTVADDEMEILYAVKQI